MFKKGRKEKRDERQEKKTKCKCKWKKIEKKNGRDRKKL